MNAFAQLIEPTHHCNVCNETKAISLFALDSKNKLGYRPLCKDCRSVKNAAQRARRAAQAVEQVLSDRDAREADTSIARPRTYTQNKTHWTPPAPEYVRNNGNKHIPSKGVST